MNFEIPAETFVRLAGVTRRIPVGLDETEIKYLRCVRLERVNGHVFAIASNRKVAAIYHFMDTVIGVDGVAHITIDPALIKQCETEKPFNSSLYITVIPELQMASVKTTLGYNYPGNGMIHFAETPLDNWRKWVPDEPITETNGAMSWNIEDMEALNRASPSGEIAFPEFIDASAPVILRDIKSPDWLGMFMPNRVDDNGRGYTVTPAELPTWFK